VVLQKIEVEKTPSVDQHAWALSLDFADLERMECAGAYETACPHGCEVEPDGHCPHGYSSPLLILGLI